MRRYVLPILVLVVFITSHAFIIIPTYAQAPIFPLPAPLYILTSNHMLLRVDPITGEQTMISSPDQPIADFDISPDGEWYVYRSPANNMVIVSKLDGSSGFAVEFTDSMPQTSSVAQTIAWSPDAAAIAYIVTDGIRIAELGTTNQGDSRLSTIQGNWLELYWLDVNTLVASDDLGQTTRISGTHNQWIVEPVSGVPMRVQSAFPAFIGADGVTLDGQTVIPHTVGTLAFEWGPPAPPVVSGLVLPANLYYLAPGTSSITQVWQLPQTGAAARPLTAENAPVLGYGIAPDQNTIAYIVSGRLVIANVDGTNRHTVAVLQLENQNARPVWSPDQTQIAYHDQQGIWIVPVDGSQPPRALLTNQRAQSATEANSVRVYTMPQWSSDGTRLLVNVGFYESGILGIVDVATRTLTELNAGVASRGRWMDDDHVITWAAQWGYETPGLFLINSVTPAAEPVRVLEAGTPVADVHQAANGTWYALITSTATMGPQFLTLWVAGSAQGPFAPMYNNAVGGFVAHPQLTTPQPGQVGAIMIAGLRALTYNEQGLATGNLIIVDMNTGTPSQVQTFGPVGDVQWGQ